MYEELLKNTALADERFIVMTAENRALVKNLPVILGNRFIDTGITEQTIIGAAAGLALRGRIPVVHALSAFLSMRAFEFIRTDVGIANLPVKLSSFIPGFLSDGNGPTHQALEDISIMRGIPNMQVFAPADEDELVKMLPQIWDSPHPSYVRICHKSTDYQHDANFEIGKAEIISEGINITILVYGFMFEQAFLTAEILKKEGLSVGLINMRSLKPVDEQAIIKAALNSDLIVTIEDHFLTGGLYSIVAETLLRNQITVDTLPIALEERWFKPARLHEVLDYEGFTGEKMALKILTYFEEVCEDDLNDNNKYYE